MSFSSFDDTYIKQRDTFLRAVSDARPFDGLGPDEDIDMLLLQMGYESAIKARSQTQFRDAAAEYYTADVPRLVSLAQHLRTQLNAALDELELAQELADKLFEANADYRRISGVSWTKFNDTLATNSIVLDAEIEIADLRTRNDWQEQSINTLVSNVLELTQKLRISEFADTDRYGQGERIDTLEEEVESLRSTLSLFERPTADITADLAAADTSQPGVRLPCPLCPEGCDDPWSVESDDDEAEVEEDDYLSDCGVRGCSVCR